MHRVGKTNSIGVHPRRAGRSLGDRSCAVALLAACLVLAGCAAPQAQRPAPLTLADLGKAQAMDLAEQVLRDMHFAIDKLDVGAGLLRTRPLSGAQFFEFWRRDNATPRATAEASLHSLRRTVEMRFEPGSGGLRVACDVQVERLSIPEMEIGGMAQAASLYTASDASLQRLQLNAEQARNMAWIALGPDPELEQAILDRLQAKITQQGG